MLLDLKELYVNDEKVSIIEEVLLQMHNQMKTNMKLSSDDNEEEQDPTVYLWLLYFLGQHYLFVKNFAKAFEFVNEAIEHTPTVIELYILKA